MLTSCKAITVSWEHKFTLFIKKNCCGLQVYKRSFDLCMRLYEKELLTDSSYLYIYGYVIGSVCDTLSLDFVNGEMLPVQRMKVLAMSCQTKLFLILNAAAFEVAAELLKEVRVETASEENTVSANGNETQLTESPARLTTTVTESIGGGISINDSMTRNPPGSVHGAQAAVQMLKKPSRAFRAMLGNSAAKRKFDLDEKMTFHFIHFVASAEQSQPVVKEPAKVLESMLHEEPSSVKAKSSNSDDVILIANDASMNHDEPSALPPSSTNLDSFILIEDDENVEEAITGETKNEQVKDREDKTLGSDPEMGDKDDETMSLCDLSSSFQECFKSTNQTSKPKQAEKSKESYGFLPMKHGYSKNSLKPFDYEAARKEFRFGEDRKAKKGKEGDEGHRNNSRLDKVDRKKSSVAGHSRNDKQTGDFA
ncbi:Protein RRP6-like 2 [Camellia lanceoleosa]|uniref:Protein RRP6-like 2 n=1 Tax=Camellia lanceoleosa TaxID=1840588 RepID=A0ACC0HTU1_9ERIC|nr:Protein RRP6-like 2 [Camellia lanceoleosa]